MTILTLKFFKIEDLFMSDEEKTNLFVVCLSETFTKKFDLDINYVEDFVNNLTNTFHQSDVSSTRDDNQTLKTVKR